MDPLDVHMIICRKAVGLDTVAKSYRCVVKILPSARISKDVHRISLHMTTRRFERFERAGVTVINRALDDRTAVARCSYAEVVAIGSQ